MSVIWIISVAIRIGFSVHAEVTSTKFNDCTKLNPFYYSVRIHFASVHIFFLTSRFVKAFHNYFSFVNIFYNFMTCMFDLILIFCGEIRQRWLLGIVNSLEHSEMHDSFHLLSAFRSILAMAAMTELRRNAIFSVCRAQDGQQGISIYWPRNKHGK